MSETTPRPLRGTVRSPNIWGHPATYEIENHAFDPSGLVETTMRGLAAWSGRTFLDLGCGTGFHLPRWTAAHDVVGVEPHPGLAALARRRVLRWPNVRVLEGTAQDIPLPDASVDIVHARWAYFFGPGCEPGLAEIARVTRRGGTAFVIDNDPTCSTFGGWFRRGYPEVDPVAVERFWSINGWQRHPVRSSWSFSHRADFEAVVRIEFDPATAKHVLDTHQGCEVDYAVNLWSRTF